MLIGARTQLSAGKGSVAEWKKAALAAGYSAVVDELHDRQRGLRLQIVDAAGGEARVAGIMVHDEMHWFAWCGGHRNALPNSLGLDPDGNVAHFSAATRVNSSFQGITGPAASGYDMWRYVPWGADASAPAVGIPGDVRLFSTHGNQLPDAGEWYTSRARMPYGTRDIMIELLAAERVVR
ncbi:MAG: hypothetical protein HYU36_17010 [Planctomycetes bacterium]|nr:hypothetical protein [Planctomycetota bacterium]